MPGTIRPKRAILITRGRSFMKFKQAPVLQRIEKAYTISQITKREKAWKKSQQSKEKQTLYFTNVFVSF